ncbi:hypothetical protein JZ751_021835 [Albula glossodonta]|uniref:Uncharacterized protein n=1 Tax=Albula glossodonta TaxID=121402 RepID=A0A8T2MR51_9TELE|nr:hypothetical protein JZ751_021835 [Albula glossodonta]
MLTPSARESQYVGVMLVDEERETGYRADCDWGSEPAWYRADCDWGSEPAGYRADCDWGSEPAGYRADCDWGSEPGTELTVTGALSRVQSCDWVYHYFCCSSGSPSFQPIRSQVCIPTAHVMPSTAGAPRPAAPAPPLVDSHSASSASSSSKSSPLPKSASSPNLEAQGRGSGGGDCLSRYRSLVNGLDHSLLPPAERHRFDTPAMEPTLNQSGLLGSFLPEPCARLQLTGLADPAPESTYKVLPEAPPSATPDNFGIQSSSSTMLAPPQTLSSHSWLRDPPAGSGGDPRWQQLESLRLQVEQMQLLTAGSGQYSSLYPPSLHPEGGAWDSVVKASEALLKEKELVIESRAQSETEAGARCSLLRSRNSRWRSWSSGCVTASCKCMGPYWGEEPPSLTCVCSACR